MAVVLAEEGTHAAGRVAALGTVLDLHDLGAEVGEEHGPVRPGAEVLEGQHAVARERLLHAGFLATRCRAMIMHCTSLAPSPMHISLASQ